MWTPALLDVSRCLGAVRMRAPLDRPFVANALV